MRIDIGDFHEEEAVGTVTSDGDLDTESKAFRSVAEPLIRDGIYTVYPVAVEDDEVAYHEFHIEPGDEGFLREFVDALPSPYDCDMDVLGDLPTFTPENNLDKADFPPECRSCGERNRMTGSFVCPHCHDDIDEDEYDGGIVGETKADNPVSTGTSGVRNPTYGGAGGGETDLSDERWQSDYMEVSKKRELHEEWKKSGMTYEEVDDLLFNAYKRTVWWEPSDDEDLSKAPDMWRADDYVPEFVKEFIREVIGEGAVFDNFKDLPHTAGLKMQEIFRDNLTQPQGWSVHSLVSDLQEVFPSLDDQQAKTIARTETASVLNSAREEAYEARPDSNEYEFYWSNAQDHRTTDLCNDIIEEVESRGGSVPLPELRKIVEAAARAYEYGTPERVDDWTPHYNCRSSFIRAVHL
jgi:hypothetical protein